MIINNKELNDKVQTGFWTKIIGNFDVIKIPSGTLPEKECITFICEINPNPETSQDGLAKALSNRMCDMLTANRPYGSSIFYMFETLESLIAPTLNEGVILNPYLTCFEIKENNLNPPIHKVKLVLRGHFDLRYSLPEKVVCEVDGIPSRYNEERSVYND